MEKLKSQSALHASYIFSNIKRASSAAALARTYIYSKNTLSRNRTYNCPLGGGCYIHLTMRARKKYITIIRLLRQVFWIFFPYGLKFLLYSIQFITFLLICQFIQITITCKITGFIKNKYMVILSLLCYLKNRFIIIPWVNHCNT